jgi:hypothetical protein
MTSPSEPFRDKSELWRANAARVYWRAENIRLRTLWWLQDRAVLPIARRSAARWAAGRPVPAWWRALLILLLTRVDD